MANIKKMVRNQVWNNTTQAQADGDSLWLLVDVYEDGTCEEVMVLEFADYAGLEAEFEAATATTVLLAAVAAELANTLGLTTVNQSQREDAMDDIQIQMV